MTACIHQTMPLRRGGANLLNGLLTPNYYSTMLHARSKEPAPLYQVHWHHASAFCRFESPHVGSYNFKTRSKERRSCCGWKALEMLAESDGASAAARRRR